MDRTRSHPPQWRVLVAQDVADGLAEGLAGGGYEVTACRPEEAAGVAARFHPHLVLCDLPADGGTDGVRRMREGTGGVRVFAVGVWGEEWWDEREAAVAAGCDGLLVRPVAPEVVDWLTAFGLAATEAEVGVAVG